MKTITLPELKAGAAVIARQQNQVVAWRAIFVQDDAGRRSLFADCAENYGNRPHHRARDFWENNK